MLIVLETLCGCRQTMEWPDGDWQREMIEVPLARPVAPWEGIPETVAFRTRRFVRSSKQRNLFKEEWEQP